MLLKDKYISYHGNEVSAAYENAYYISREGPIMIRVRVYEIGDDIYDVCHISYSIDDGCTWTDDQPYQTSFATLAGMVRKGYGYPVVDQYTGALLLIDNTVVLPSDNNLEGLTNSFLTYRVSEDGGITWLFEDRIIQADDEDTYNPKHPVKSIWIGRNAMYFANHSFIDTAGRLILPVQITRLNSDGSIFCPPGALTFMEMIILIGTWQDNGRMRWEASDKVILEPDVSTRGAFEGTIAEMPDGRFLMVMRGSNAGNPSLPGHKWYCISNDGCYTWSEVKPWGYTDGKIFNSPSSYSTVLKHSNGRYYWVGNICRDNPDGNGPDYPVYIGEIDPDSFMLRKDSLLEIDTYTKDDPAPMHLRNFSIYEERSTMDLVMRMCRLWVDEARHMRGDTYIYRIGV